MSDSLPMPKSIPEAAQMTSFKSNSLGGGGGANEITMNDTAGAEGLFIKAQKDQIVTVGNDRESVVMNDDTLYVGSDRTETIGRNRDAIVAANETTHIGGDQTSYVAGSRFAEISRNDDLAVKGEHSAMIEGICNAEARQLVSRKAASGSSRTASTSIDMATMQLARLTDAVSHAPPATPGELTDDVQDFAVDQVAIGLIKTGAAAIAAGAVSGGMGTVAVGLAKVASVVSNAGDILKLTKWVARVASGTIVGNCSGISLILNGLRIQFRHLGRAWKKAQRAQPHPCQSVVIRTRMGSSGGGRPQERPPGKLSAAVCQKKPEFFLAIAWGTAKLAL